MDCLKPPPGTPGVARSAPHAVDGVQWLNRLRFYGRGVTTRSVFPYTTSAALLPIDRRNSSTLDLSMPLGRRGQTHSATHFAELTAVFNLDEEHRLMYLGITRAKELLTLSWSAPNATARSTATSPATSCARGRPPLARQEPGGGQGGHPRNHRLAPGEDRRDAGQQVGVPRRLFR